MTDAASARTTHEREFTAPVELCDAAGRLNPAAIGWSRHPLHRCNLSDATPRKKRWNYWCVTSDRLLISATVADIDYAALAFVYVYDRATHYFAEKTAVVGPGLALPQTVAGDIVFADSRMRVALTDEGAGTRIAVDCPDFRDASLQADIVVERPPGHETLNVVIPWSAEEFQFTSKQNCLPARGAVSLGEDVYDFGGDASFACLDYGRGIWPRETSWNWGAASGHQFGHQVGLNLGGRWTDGTGMTENAICVDGRLHKIGDDLTFDYDDADRMAPWSIRTRASDRVTLRFVPEYERISKADTPAYSSEVHQMFGSYSGRVRTEDGEAIAISYLFGWIEDHSARW